MRLKQHGTTAILGANSSLHKKSTPSGPSHVCCDILPERLRLGARDVWHSSVLLLEQRQQSPTTAVTNDSSHLRIILVNLAVYLYDAHNICCTVLFNRGAMQKTVSIHSSSRRGACDSGRRSGSSNRCSCVSCTAETARSMQQL